MVSLHLDGKNLETESKTVNTHSKAGTLQKPLFFALPNRYDRYIYYIKYIYIERERDCYYYHYYCYHDYDYC